MAFMFKLSRRWARLRTVMVVGTPVVPAGNSRCLTSVDEVDRVALSPSAVTVQPNQASDFSPVDPGALGSRVLSLALDLRR